MDRRELLKSIGTLSLIGVAFQQRAFSARHSSIGAQWALQLRLQSEQLLRQEISQTEWQRDVGRLRQYDRVALQGDSLDIRPVFDGTLGPGPNSHRSRRSGITRERHLSRSDHEQRCMVV